jgi:pimeloyl-ACP methyl ester carboxylesterase
MAAAGVSLRPGPAPLWGELRFGGELARMLLDMPLHGMRRGEAHSAPVLLIPGFMAGDASLAVLGRWLRRRGHHVETSGIRMNVDCAGRMMSGLEAQLAALACDAGDRVFVIGQSRGGALARCLAVRRPEHVCGLAMLGTPVLDPLAVSPSVMLTVRALARLGDAGLPRTLTSTCWEGPCCSQVRAELTAPLAGHIEALSVYSRSDGIVDWRACLDEHCEQVEVDSSHCGMSVHPAVYRTIDEVLDETEASPWNG